MITVGLAGVTTIVVVKTRADLGQWHGLGLSFVDWAQVVGALAAVIGVIGVGLAFGQIRQGAAGIRAQLLTKLNEEWRSQQLYDGNRYLLGLGRNWKRTGGAADALALEWVRARASTSNRRWSHQNRSEEWNHRRLVAQYLRHAGYLLSERRITPDDVFSAIPETGRLLEVLIPLENAVIAYYDQGAVTARSAPWDVTARKWELDYLFAQYEKWFAKNELKRFGPHPQLPTATFTD
jgi:hypothetical protein